MIPMDVVGVRLHLPDNEIVVVLAEQGGSRLVPILVGPREGGAIASAQAGVVPPRPLTHDLLRDVLATLGVDLVRVEIVALLDGVFYASLVLSTGQTVDSRASDAIALALRTDSPVLCAADVVDQAGVTLGDEDAEEEVERFRAFLDEVTPEDFETGREPGGAG